MEKITDQIEKIRDKLEQGNLSVLIGAGFSQNVSKMFPDWNSLLYDLVKELYESEIIDSYNAYLASLQAGSEFESKSDFHTRKIKEIISKIGYLEVVSEYIKRKGYREAITTYIEAKTPHIVDKETKLFLRNKVNEEELTKEMLFQHKLLLQLPWNNVYTTNYDELLEYSIDKTAESELKKRIDILEKLIQKNENSKNEAEEKLENEKLNLAKNNRIIEGDTKKNISNNIDYERTNIFSLSNNKSINELKNEENRIRTEISKLELSLYSLSNSVKEDINRVKQFYKELNECYTIVKHSSDLSIKRNKNIIKLHGTLRSNNKDKFGFDGDIHRHYIIAKEDYETYPKEHEAFTQLMRISLLQESFVLIGFSGVDPNFISWISWVRDILERKNISDDYKIYLIDVSKDKIGLDRELFFKNHRIIRIPIMDNSVIEYLQSETELKIEDKENIKEVVTLFLKYLLKKVPIDNVKTTLEQRQKEAYSNLWNSIKSFRPSDIDLSSVPKISELDKYSIRERFSNLNFAYFHKKSELLYFSAALLEKVKDNTDVFQSIIKLIEFAIKDSFLTTTSIWEDQEIEKVKKIVVNTELDIELKKITVRDYVLKVDRQNFNKLSLQFDIMQPEFIKYEEILLSAFNFDFDTLYDKLEEWTPQDDRVLNKAGLLALFNIDTAINLLKQYSASVEYVTNQEQLYIYELLHYIVRCKTPWPIDEELSRKVKAYKENGFKSINDNLDYLIDELEEKENKIKPYGAERFTISNAWNFFNSSSKPQEGLQFIQILIESGFPIRLPNICLISQEKWYSIFKSIYEYYPYPCLFFTLQYSDENFLKRVAQDYIYSENLKNMISEITTKLLDAYDQKKIPERFKNNILIFIPELIIACPSSLWQKRFRIIWNRLKNKNQLFLAKYDNQALDFIRKTLLYIEDRTILQNVIYDILNNLGTDSNIAIEYLYHTAKNKYFEENRHQFLSIKLHKQVKEIISSISKDPDIYMFVLGNLHDILTEEDKNDILTALLETDLTTVNSERVWHVILYFACNNKMLHSKIKKAIINNKNLWYTGISGHTVSSGRYDFIVLQNLRKDRQRQNGLNWTKNEAGDIFMKLQFALNEIKRIKLEISDISFESVLEEMYQFVLDEGNKIKQIDNYNVVCEDLKNVYFNERGYLTLYEGLVSNDKSIAILALSELFSDIYRSAKLVHKEEIKLVLNKIVFQKDPAIEASLSYIANMIWTFHKNNSFMLFSTQLVEILKKYKMEELIECDKPFVQEKLIKIAKVLNYWGNNEESVLYWINIGKNSIYNNIIRLNKTTLPHCEMEE